MLFCRINQILHFLRTSKIHAGRKIEIQLTYVVFRTFISLDNLNVELATCGLLYSHIPTLHLAVTKNTGGGILKESVRL